ncbi:hypothetical protein K523DRAFT_322149 [Schizophyllum commune Tattone D]|nr:hypothetical protein K523DRAFT_322149 [Schizophyllum commune Tattone D]
MFVPFVELCRLGSLLAWLVANMIGMRDKPGLGVNTSRALPKHPPALCNLK